MRLIDGDKLVKAIRTDYYEHFTGCHSSSEITLLDMILDDIEEQPTIEAAPVVHGEWVKVEEWATKAKYRCSICGREILSSTKVNIEKYPYCHCGAKMKGE